MYSCAEFYFPRQNLAGVKCRLQIDIQRPACMVFLEEVIGTDLTESCMCRMDQGCKQRMQAWHAGSSFVSDHYVGSEISSNISTIK